MNERILELAKQAGIELFEDKAFKWSVIAGTDHHLQKFAELIVKECVDIADEYDGAGSTIVSRIKKHFGVEPDVNENLRNRSTYFGNDV